MRDHMGLKYTPSPITMVDEDGVIVTQNPSSACSIGTHGCVQLADRGAAVGGGVLREGPRGGGHRTARLQAAKSMKQDCARLRLHACRLHTLSTHALSTHAHIYTHTLPLPCPPAARSYEARLAGSTRFNYLTQLFASEPGLEADMRRVTAAGGTWSRRLRISDRCAAADEAVRTG